MAIIVLVSTPPVIFMFRPCAVHCMGYFSAIYYDKEKEKDITELLKECCYEWYVFDKEEESFVKCVETICIA